MDVDPFLTARRLFTSPNVTPGASIEIAIKKVDEGCLRRFLTLERHFQKELVEDGLQVLKVCLEKACVDSQLAKRGIWVVFPVACLTKPVGTGQEHSHPHSQTGCAVFGPADLPHSL